MSKIIEIKISCSTQKEALKIGKELLKNRFVGCIDIIAKTSSYYYWPPKKNKITKAKGYFLLAYTLPKLQNQALYLVEKLHTDKAPFFTTIEFLHSNPAYFNWLSLELK